MASSDKKKIPVISLFSGAMGLDLGLERAGFEVAVAVECDALAVETIRANKPGLPVIDRKIEDVDVSEILEAAKLKPGGQFIVAGGPSCQTFSTAGTRRSLSDPRGALFDHFIRVVREAQPKFFLMENVRGLLSAAKRHRPLDERGPGFPTLDPDEQLGSAFEHIVRKLRKLNYFTVFDLLNAADYGVPQCRDRVIIIGGRDGRPVVMPMPTHSANGSDGRPRWKTVRDAIGDLIDEAPVSATLSERDKGFLAAIPDGGNWKDLPVEQQREALGKAYDSWGGRVGFYRRLAWDRPSPSLTTVPNARATMLCHPSELRVLSVREYAAIQQFPATWKFMGSASSQYRQIGNAVPVGLGEAIGRAIMSNWNRHTRECHEKRVCTHNRDLVRRLTQARLTVFHPPRLRPGAASDGGSSGVWSTGKRTFAHRYADDLVD